VGRWSALAIGLVYGYSHNASLQKQEDAKKQQLEYERQEKLIEKARLAYAAKKNPTPAVTAVETVDIESPDFDFEKFIGQLEAQEKK
ncbi:ATP synthase E chain-domain-containing protein, partial [Fennellomyces sp. T-0311]